MPEDRLGHGTFFVVGAGRSGTTLVRSLLSAHSRLAVPPETHYLKMIDEFGARERQAPADFEAFWSRLTGWRRFRDMGIKPERVLALADAAGGRDFRTIFAAMLRAYGESQGKARVGEKTPGHYQRLDRIFTWFPDAKILVLRRDPRAVIASQLRAPWISEQMRPASLRAPLVPRLRAYHAAALAEIWVETYGRRLAHVDADPRLKLVAYEDLVTAPEGEVRAICDFLGESFEPAMLGDRTHVPGAAAKQQLRSDTWRTWLVAHEQRAAGAISDESLEKWRDQLSRFEVQTIERICEPLMERFGYRSDTRRALFIPHGRAMIQAARLEAQARSQVAKLRGLLRSS